MLALACWHAPAAVAAEPAMATGSAAIERVVAAASTPDAAGYWLVTDAGRVTAHGSARHLGDLSGVALTRPIVGMAATPSGGGYWLVAGDGGIFAFGDAPFLGSTGGIVLNQPVVSMTPTPTGAGYWMVASDGGVFTFGDATFHGSTGDVPLNEPIRGITRSPSGLGYRLVAADGGVFSFGDAPFYGSTGAAPPPDPIVAMAPSPSARGYWTVSSGGSVFAFGDAAFLGDPDGAVGSAEVVGIAADPVAQGYLVILADGQALRFGAPAAAPGPSTIAVIGDVPYGEEQEGRIGELVSALNADPAVELVIHLGDIKSGDTSCTDARFMGVLTALQRLDDPLVYTPGDNEWTDCHRTGPVSFHPLERLQRLRQLFFATPGQTLGAHPRTVAPQPGYPEDVRWLEADVVFATLHVVGSGNGTAPWTGLGHTTPTPEQVAEVDARVAATVAWIDSTFDIAEAQGLAGVVLAMQADTWNPGPSRAQREVVEQVAARSAAFGGQVLVLQGDSHAYRADHPLGPNVTRIVVHGERLPFEYLRLTIDPASPSVFRWVRVDV